MFSRRLAWDARPNPLSLLLERKRCEGARILDLTESNPTRAGIEYPESALLDGLAQPAALRYDPAPCGLESARKAVSQYYASRGVTVEPSRILLTASTSEAYSYLFKLLADPGSEILIPRPSYPLFEFLAQLESVMATSYPLRYDGIWHIDFESLEGLITPQTKAIVVVNPNNPTGTVTSRSDIEYLLANKPQGSVVMIDEAYIHFSKSAVPCTDLAARDQDVVILRTFSKLYGMAGLRAGAAIARPELLQKVTQWSAGAMPTTAMVGATASLKVNNLVTERRKFMTDIREDTCNWLTAKNVEVIPSETNCFMINVKRSGRSFAAEMAKQNVYIGRAWPIWPNWVRVSVGTKDEMAKFKDAFAKAYNA